MSIKDINQNALPACDNECAFLGYTEEWIINNPDFTESRHISIKPTADIDDEFIAFNHDIQECQRIIGKAWLFECLTINE